MAAELASADILVEPGGMPRKRTICPNCFRSSSDARCQVCGGSKQVCPDCRGAHMVQREGDDRNFVVSCPGCTDPVLDMKGKQAYNHHMPIYQLNDWKEANRIQAYDRQWALDEAADAYAYQLRNQPAPWEAMEPSDTQQEERIP